MLTRALRQWAACWKGATHDVLDGEWGEYKSVAREAKLDAMLTSAIFTPYVGGGFRVTSGNED